MPRVDTDETHPAPRGAGCEQVTRDGRVLWGLPCTEPTVVTGLTLGPHLDLGHLILSLPPSESGPDLLLPTSHLTSCKWARLPDSRHLPWERRWKKGRVPPQEQVLSWQWEGGGAGVSWLEPNGFLILAFSVF